ncbi:patatin-like phospholipase [Aspergillus granulosus]|uniref:Patatin-like phospholipase n=1 Tax=Aspergillus granulosus TaxID=176169 RepID=A0ABR4GTH2_9EURO
MYYKSDNSWLEVNTGQNGALVRDHGRLSQVISELPHPDQQYPILSVFLGGKRKDHILQILSPHNNIRRTNSGAHVRLRCETVSAETNEPLLLADGDLGESNSCKPPQMLPGDKLISFRPLSTKSLLQQVYSRLIFPFANLICVFATDFPDLASIAQSLVGCAGTGSTCYLPPAVRPKVIVVLEDGGSMEPESLEHDIARFYDSVREIDRPRLQESFSSLNVIRLDRKLPETIQHERLRTCIRDQQIAIQAVRRAHWYLFSARQLDALFQSALKSFSVESQFDLVRATRTDFPVSAGLPHHLAHFLEIGLRGGCSLDTLGRSIASTLLMDHYVPGMMMLEPRIVFRTLYLPAVVRGGQRANSALGQRGDELVDLVEREFVRGFHQVSTSTKTSVELQRETLMSLSHELGKIQSHTICLYCLVRCAQHCQRCHHSICDHCAQVFGSPASNVEYQFTLSMCLLCLSRDKLVVDVLPPTMTPTILAIDGGGVRGVIPLEYLILIQESLGRDCKLCDLVDLSVGPSSGGLIALGLSGMEWDVSTCSQMFDRLARRIFEERIQSSLSRVLRFLFGQYSLLGAIFQWLSWFCQDGCYDTRIFDASLREAFREERRIFGVVGVSSHSKSRSKFGVIATNIAKETRSFVFGNFNAADWFAGQKHEYQLFRAEKADDEPLIWEVARATAAAPFYFSTANLGPSGSFQDGGLKDNFAADIARRICRRIWSSKPGITRLISLGTGRTDAPPNRSPPFRHVFRDGFLPRSYEAFMSQMDATPKWLRMKNELDEALRQDYLRLDVPLKNIPCTIDDTNVMDEYRNLVIGQPGSGQMARDVASALLVGRFYFTLRSVPEKVTGGEYVWCHGTVRCKGPVREIVASLLAKHPQRMEFVTDTEHLAYFGGLDDICVACGRYSKPISMLLRNCDQTTNIYLRVSRERKWRISGFPTDMSSVAAAQKLEAPFGRPDHGHPAVVPCASCDGTIVHLAGRRRKRTSAPEDELASKRVCVVGDVRT